MSKIITLTGTPGTGKTEVARVMAKKLDCELLSINDLIENKELRYTIDKLRKTKVVDVKILQKLISKKTKNRSFIIEGHYSHFLKSDLTIILRCNPSELAKRLKKKGWNHAKIKENIESELIGVISAEASRNKHAIEIDTSGKKPEMVVVEIMKKIQKSTTTFPVGNVHTHASANRIDWLNPKIFSRLKKVLD